MKAVAMLLKLFCIPFTKEIKHFLHHDMHTQMKKKNKKTVGVLSGSISYKIYTNYDPLMHQKQKRKKNLIVSDTAYTGCKWQ